MLHVYVMLELNETNGGINALLTGLVGVGHGGGGAREKTDITNYFQHGLTNINNEKPFRSSLMQLSPNSMKF